MNKRIAYSLLPLAFLAVSLIFRHSDSDVMSGQAGAGSRVQMEMTGVSSAESASQRPEFATAKGAAIAAPRTDREAEGDDAFASFTDWTERYLNAGSRAVRDALVEEGAALAAERRRVLKEMIRVDPEGALGKAVPWAVRQELPAAVLAELEQRVSGSGDLDVYALTPKPNDVVPEQSVFHLFESGGERFEAFVYGERLADRTRQGISAHGIAIDGLLAMHENPLRVLDAGEPLDQEKEFIAFSCDHCRVEEPSSLTTAPDSDLGAVVVESGTRSYFIGADGECYSAHMEAAQDNESDTPDLRSTLYETLGEKDVLVIRVTFDFEIDPDEVDENGEPIQPPEPVTEEDAYTTMLAINEHYSHSSHQQFSFKAIHVTPLYMMGGGQVRKPDYYWNPAQNINRYLELYDHAREAAANDGYAYGYDFVVVAFPDIGFPWAGLGRVGAKRAWIQQTDGLGEKVTTHELGHNFGLFHAGFWRTQGPVGSTPIQAAQSIEYGNVFDMMGSGGFSGSHFSGNFKSMMDWIPSNYLHSIPDETGTDVYRIHRLDGGARLRPGHHYTARIINPNHTSLPEEPKKDYWLDFRQLGSGSSRMLDGVVVQWGDGGPGQGGTGKGSHLLNMNSNLWLEFPDQTEETPLAIGETFSDQFLNIHITPLERGGPAGPDEYIDVLVTRGLLKVAITEPVPDPSYYNPAGIIDIPGGDPYELAAMIEISASALEEVHFYLDGQSLGQAEYDSETDAYRLAIATRGYDAEVKEVYATVTNEAGNTVRSKPIFVRFNNPPLLLDFIVSPSTISLGNSVNLAVAPDPDSEPIERVEFLIDGELVETVTEAPFIYEWYPDSQGTFQVEAEAYDFNGELVNLGPQNVTVTAQVSEDIALVLSNDSPGFGEGITLSATEGDSGIVIDTVHFMADGENIGEVGQSPYALDWTPLLAGDRSVWAVVTDTSGVERASVIRTVQVASPVLTVEVFPAFAMPGETVTLSATSDVESWAIAGLEYRVDGVHHAAVSGFEPVTFVAPESGVVSIEARAFDQHGNHAEPGFASFAVQGTLNLPWTAGSAATDSSMFAGVAGGDGRLVIAGAGGTVLYSDDGSLWSAANLPTSFTVRGLAYGAGRYVAVGDGGTIATSDDGVVWENRISGVSTTLHGVGYHSGLFLAVGDQGVILSSTSGIDWDQRSSSVGVTLRQVGYGFGKWYLVGNGGTVLRSDNGLDWEALPLVTTLGLYGVAFGKDTMVIVGGRQLSLTSSEGVILTSFDGEGWENQSLDRLLHSVAFGNQAFVASGLKGALFSSYDGLEWRGLDSETPVSFHGAIAYEGGFLAHGTQGAAWLSAPVADQTTTYERWLALHLNGNEIQDLDTVRPTASRDGAEPNLLLYALGLALGEPVVNAHLGRLAWTSVEGEQRLALIYPASLIRTDLVYTPEASADLVTWAPLNGEVVGTVDRGDHEEVTLVLNPSSDEANLFLRLGMSLVIPW